MIYKIRVSTDYILDLSTVSVQKSYDISELGLSEGAVRGLVTEMVDVEILNRLLEHKNFPRLISLIQIYFQDTAARGIMAPNQVIKIATASLSDLVKDRPEYRAEARQDIQFMNAQKLGEHEAKIEKNQECVYVYPAGYKGRYRQRGAAGGTSDRRHVSKYPDRCTGAEAGITYH